MQEVRGVAHTVTASVTRPADTNAYTSGDALSDSTSAPTVLTFSRATLGKGSSAMIQQAILISSANVATKPDVELWLFDTAPTAQDDNAAFAPSDAELEKLIAVIDFPTASFKAGGAGSGASGNAVCDVQNLAIPINTLMTSNDIYAVPVLRNAYAPVSAEKWTIRLKMVD